MPVGGDDLLVVGDAGCVGGPHEVLIFCGIREGHYAGHRNGNPRRCEAVGGRERCRVRVFVIGGVRVLALPNIALAVRVESENDIAEARGIEGVPYCRGSEASVRIEELGESFYQLTTYWMECGRPPRARPQSGRLRSRCPR